MFWLIQHMVIDLPAITKSHSTRCQIFTRVEFHAHLSRPRRSFRRYFVDQATRLWRGYKAPYKPLLARCHSDMCFPVICVPPNTYPWGSVFNHCLNLMRSKLYERKATAIFGQRCLVTSVNEVGLRNWTKLGEAFADQDTRNSSDTVSSHR